MDHTPMPQPALWQAAGTQARACTAACSGACCRLLYHQPDAFAFWWMHGAPNAPGQPPWLFAEGVRLSCPFETARPCGAENGESCIGDGLGGLRTAEVPASASKAAGVLVLEVAKAYYGRKARQPSGQAGDVPDARHIACAAERRRAELARLFEDVWAYRGDGLAAALFHEGKVCEAIAYLIETRPETAEAAYMPGLCMCGEDRLCIERVTDYLHANLHEELSLDRLCQLACMSKTKLKRAFRSEHRCTLTEYLQQQRVLEAKRLLRETDLPIAEVAREIGYLAGGRFAILFRQITGYLPSEYRRFFL